MILLADEPRELGSDAFAASAALVDVAALVLGASRRAAPSSDRRVDRLPKPPPRARAIARGDRTRTTRSLAGLVPDARHRQPQADQRHLRASRRRPGTTRGRRKYPRTAARLRPRCSLLPCGDEFLVVLPATEQGAALGAGTRIGAAVARVRAPADATARMLVSVTFGAATSRSGDPPDTLLERADQALLNAKHRARASRPAKTLEPDRRAFQSEPPPQIRCCARPR